MKRGGRNERFMSVIVDGRVKLTYQEFRHFPDDGNTHELIDGEHHMAPAPGTGHQYASRHIQFQLFEQLELTGMAQVYDAPTDVELSEVDIVEPDLMVVAASRRRIIKPSRIVGPPDLIVEILSPSTSARDRELKLRLYEQSGVPVYWIVDPAEKCVTVYVQADDSPIDGGGKASRGDKDSRVSAGYREVGQFTRTVRLELGDLRAEVDLTRVWQP
jgi:Uma2 family endonuclease